MDDNKPVLLTLHEALRTDLIEAYMAREITLAEVAESMELTRRQCSRLIALSRAGASRSGQPAPWKARQSSVKHHHQRSGTAAYSLTRPGMNPSAIWRILTTEYGVRISKETVRKLMIAEKTRQPRSSSKA